MYAAPTYLHYGAYGAYGATVPSEISALAGSFIGLDDTGDILGVLEADTPYVDYEGNVSKVAPRYSLYFPLGARGTLFPGAKPMALVHTGDAEYNTAVATLAPILRAGAYTKFSAAEFQAAYPDGVTAEALSAGTTTGRGSLLRPSGAKSVRPKKQAAQPVSRAPAGLPFDPKEPWKSPVFWLLVVSGVLVVGGVGYAALKD